MTFSLQRQGAKILVLALFSSASWCQQNPPVILQFAPKDLAIAAGERRQILVVASVTGSSVRNLKLRALPEPGTHVVIGKAAEHREEIRGDVSWPVSITKDSDGKASSRIVFEAEYESGEKAAPLRGLTPAVFEITVKQRPKNEEVATAVVQTSVEKLEERRPQNVYLVVTNVTDVPVTVTEVSVILPAFARVSVDGQDITPLRGSSVIYSSLGQAQPMLIPPRQGSLFRMVLNIPEYEAVMTGKYLMLFHVKLRYTKDGYTTESSIVAPHEFQAGVLGEQEFVGVTSVPFLLLPGFLVVTALGFLLSKVWPKWKIDPNFKNPDFYLIGVVVSLATVLVYKPLSPWLYRTLWRVQISERDLFAGISLEDIINTWVLALAVVLVPWILVGGVARIFAEVNARALKDLTPTTHDEPLDVILRLQRAGKSFALSQATRGGARLWELPLPSPDPAKKWVSQRICVTFQDSNSPVARQFRDLLNQPLRFNDLYNLLSGPGDTVTLKWQPDLRPELVDKKDAPTATGAREEFIYER